MVSLVAYDRVITQIYEAALVPAQWDRALTQMITEFAPRNWEVAFLMWERHTPPSGRFLGSAGVNPMAHDVYINSFAGNNEWSFSSRKLPVGQVAHTDQLVRRQRFYDSSMYRDFLQHWGYGVAIIGMLDRHGPDQLGLVLPGPIEREPGELLTAVPFLLPHFQRAARISRRIAEADLRTSAATSLLDSSPYSVFALAPDMYMLLANSSAQAQLEHSPVISLRSGRLHVADAAAQLKLEAMSKGLDPDRTFSVTLVDDAGQSYIYTALPVAPQLGDQFENSAGGATLMLIGGQRVGVSGQLVEQLEQSFGLTAAEARLAGHMLEGGGLQGYMRDRSVTIHAARFLLKSIYAKTGVRNQAELTAYLREAPLGWSPLALG